MGVALPLAARDLSRALPFVVASILVAALVLFVGLALVAGTEAAENAAAPFDDADLWLVTAFASAVLVVPLVETGWSRGLVRDARLGLVAGAEPARCLAAGAIGTGAAALFLPIAPLVATVGVLVAGPSPAVLPSLFAAWAGATAALLLVLGLAYGFQLVAIGAWGRRAWPISRTVALVSALAFLLHGPALERLAEATGAAWPRPGEPSDALRDVALVSPFQAGTEIHRLLLDGAFDAVPLAAAGLAAALAIVVGLVAAARIDPAVFFEA
ncbi:MAG: hypothetical protein ACT4PT_09765 [Methanobacteriota archaeon]